MNWLKIFIFYSVKPWTPIIPDHGNTKFFLFSQMAKSLDSLVEESIIKSASKKNKSKKNSKKVSRNSVPTEIVNESNIEKTLMNQKPTRIKSFFNKIYHIRVYFLNKSVKIITVSLLNYYNPFPTKKFVRLSKNKSPNGWILILYPKKFLKMWFVFF